MLKFSNISRPSERFSQQNYKIINLLVRHYFKKPSSEEYSQCYKILELPVDSDQECVRKAFIDLCKKYHPDSGKSSACASKFQEIECAYRILQNKFAEERWNVNEGIGEYGLYYKEKNKKDSTNEEEEPVVLDIKHTAPQHRQYLSYDGIGSGTPSQREKQFIKYRRVVAAENVYNHQIKKYWKEDNSEGSLIAKDKKEAKKIKTRYGVERLVEDLIQESMAKGQFDNLKNQGKPLPNSNYNPYVDFVTHKMNEILIDNGFTPEWITLNREILDEIQLLKDKLIKEREKLGPLPLNHSEMNNWFYIVNNLKETVEKLNKKINKFNLVVPVMQKQKLYFNLEKESHDVLKFGKYSKSKSNSEENKYVEKEEKEHFFTSFFSFLNK